MIWEGDPRAAHRPLLGVGLGSGEDQQRGHRRAQGQKVKSFHASPFTPSEIVSLAKHPFVPSVVEVRRHNRLTPLLDYAQDERSGERPKNRFPTPNLSGSNFQMSPPNLSAPPATGPSPADIPAFADLAADPEIAPLLSFDPVVRKIRRPDGWTAELQRELIARLAATGTIQAAVWQMGKHATGAEALYKTPTATSFRASWDAAVIIGRRRNGLNSQPPYRATCPASSTRPKILPARGRGTSAAGGGDDEPEMDRRKTSSP